MIVGTLADITPNGVAVPLSATPGTMVTWIQIVAPGANAADARTGDSNIGAARGARIPKGTSFLYPRNDFEQGQYDLSKIYVYTAAGSDSLSVTFGA